MMVVVVGEICWRWVQQVTALVCARSVLAPSVHQTTRLRGNKLSYADFCVVETFSRRDLQATT